MNTVVEYSFIGLSAGSAYALVALGLVVVFRGTGVVNFAQGVIGTFGTYIFWQVFQGWGVPVAVAVVLGVAAGSTVSVAFYLLIGRRLNGVPVITRILVTLGLLLALQATIRIVWGPDARVVRPFLVEGGVTWLGIHTQYLTVVILAFTLVATAVLTWLFDRTRFGKVTTALQDSPIDTQSLGYSPVRYGSVVWLIGGGLAASAGILLVPVTSLSPVSLDGYLIPALGAAVIAGFRRFWLAAAVGLATGVVESVATGFDLGELSRVIPYAVTILAIAFTGRQLPGRGTVEVQRLFRVGNGRIRWTWVLVIAVVLIVAVFSLTSRWSDTLTITAIFGLVGLSIVVTVGYAGQVSLATLAFTGIAALLFAAVSSTGIPLILAILVTLAIVTALGLVLAAPTVRMRGVGLTIATLAFAAIVQTVVFTSDTLYNGTAGWQIADKTFLGIDFDNIVYPERYTIFVWLVLLGAVVLLANTRRSKAGRALLATRADERAAASVGISTATAKVYSFTLSTLLASLAGVLIALNAGQVGKGFTGVEGYSSSHTLSELAITVFAGVGFLFGGVLTGVFSPGGLVPQILAFSPSINDWFALLFGLNLAIALVWEPDGVVAQHLRLRRLLGRVWRRTPRPASTAVRLPSLDDPVAVLRHAGGVERGEVVLGVRDLTLHYGGVVAVDDVSLDVRAGQVVGVLGPNGAGKSSLIDLVAGFARPESGRVLLRSEDITGLPPHRRTGRGLVRTFQDQLLFEDLTVRENVQSGSDATSWWDYPLGAIRPGSRRIDPAAVAALHLLDLVPFADELVENLSLGWHSRVAIARALAARPAVLCLDEPAAALSPESRAQISALIRTIARRLNIGVLLIEHNIDVILDTCDEVVVMDRGAVLAQGDPAEVLRRRDVRVAYLGEG